MKIPSQVLMKKMQASFTIIAILGCRRGIAW